MQISRNPAVKAALLEAQRLETTEAINAERNRRIRAGFTFSDVVYDFDEASKSRVTGAATLAGFAMGQGAATGDLYWHGGANPFVWVAQNNSLTPMDAQTCFAFGQEAAAHETRHIFWARALKDADPIPIDFTDDRHWQV